jgi:uncharacterized iron-regulated membrane protein
MARRSDVRSTTGDDRVGPIRRRRRRPVRAAALRLRKPMVRVHRWLSFALLAWLVVIAISGSWLAVHSSVESWIHPDRYRATAGDVGPEAARRAALRDQPDDVTVYGVTLPRNGRGVYQVGLEHPAEAEGVEPTYSRVLVDPGSGRVNGTLRDDEGATAWLYRGHMYLWQDHGIANAFAPGGWCRDGAHEKGGAIGVACDVLPDGLDVVGWFGVGWIVVLLTGFYLWYWPGVRRWATALLLQRRRGRFAFHMSLHKVVGLVVWVPLLVVSFTGVAFAFPNMSKWFENATPAARDLDLWTAPESAASGKPDGREPIGLDAALARIEQRFPTRAVQSISPPAEATGTYSAWVTRGFDPWTREAGAGNTYVYLDQYTGDVVYDGSPEDGNLFDQAWDDWSFPLHTGDFGGTTTRVAWMALALTPIALGTTGVVMNRVRAGKRKRRRAAEGATEAIDLTDQQHPANEGALEPSAT